MEIRDFKAKDVKTLAKMLGNIKPETMDSLMAIIRGENMDNPDYTAVGLAIFKALAGDLTDDIYAWLASMVNMSVEDFDELPASAPIDVVKEMVERGDFRDFFGSAIQQVDLTAAASPSTT